MDINENTNNEQQSIIENNPDLEPKKPKKKISILKVILTIFIVIGILLIAGFGIYKATVDVSNKNSSKFEYDFSQIVTEKEVNYMEFITFDSKIDPNTLFIDIPKDYFYNNILKIRDIASDIQKDTEIKINRLGTVSNAQNANLIDFYADVTYKDLINAYVTGSIRYEIIENNDINLYIDKFVIGDGFPMFFYKVFLSFKDGDLLETIKAENYEFLKDKTLDLSKIKDVHLNSSQLKFSFNYMENLINIADYMFGENASNYSPILEKIVPIVLELTIGENKEEYIDMANLYLPMLIKELVH